MREVADGPADRGGDLLTVRVTGAVVRLGWGQPDWFGPGRADAPSAPGVLSVPTPGQDWCRDEDDLGTYDEVIVADGDVSCSVRAYDGRPLAVFRIVARRDLTGLATDAYDRPAVGWPVFTPADREPAGVDPAARALAYQASEFAFPTTAGCDLDGWFLLPHRPPAAWPLLLTAADGRTLLLAPLDEFHSQTIGLGGGSLRCGWHGDLDEVPEGFTTNLAVIGGRGPRHCLDQWADIVRSRAGTVRPGRWPDALGTRPSYWTDNGAAYWYRTEPGLDVAGSIVAAVDDLRAQDVPVGAVQLDSWFYPHEVLRPFDTDEWEVPPTAMLAWEERTDVLPDGIADLRRRLGDPPLVAHIRHLAAAAPIAREIPVHVDGAAAAPSTPEAYERWLDQCIAWGVETFEHDWLVEAYFAVRGLRERPGRARAWQEGIDRAARERGVTLQWCMATPADFARTTTLTQVTSIRTCGDHGYIATPGQLWAWFCITNAFARPLGLAPFKDVFRTDPDVAGGTAMVEAMLSALSTGPVGLGDALGRFDASIVRHVCRADGVLVKPHVPIAAIDRSMLANPGGRRQLLIAECWSDQPAGRWAYVAAMHANPHDDTVTGHVDLGELGAAAPTGRVVVWDWRRRTTTQKGPNDRLEFELGHQDWSLLVVAPLLASGIAVIGDTDQFATAGDARIEVRSIDDGVRIVVKGAGERVTVTGWADSAPWSDEVAVDSDPGTGTWRVTVTVPSRGWTSFAVRRAR